MIKTALKSVINNVSLSEEHMISVMDEIMEGAVDPTLLASFLTALKIKGETSEEIAGAAKVMRAKALKVDLDNYDTIDTCGTGGDGAGTFNISTGVALVLASADVKVVKHGNRSISSKCGSADVLEALNININLDQEQVKDCILKHNIGFLFAPNYHKAMKYAMPVRKNLGFRTIFNLLGPLSNPASAKKQLLGVYDANLTEIMAQALNLLGVQRAMVVHGMDDLDEITTTTTTKVTELNNGVYKTYYIKPEDFGINRASISEIQGADAKENANILIDIFKGKQNAKRDILVLNSGAALYVANKATSIEEGINLAEQLIDEGEVYNKLEEFINYTGVLS